MQAKKVTITALLTALALILFIVEAQIPNPAAAQGFKLGLANIVTVYGMFVLGPGPTFMIFLGRVVLGSIFAGQMMTILYSFGGGLLCYFSMLVMRKILTKNQIWVCSAIGAVFHNIGQMIVAVLITRTPGILVLLPPLLVSGIIAGVFVGITAQFVVHRLPEVRL